MKKNKRSGMMPAFGGSALLVIFAVVCLAVLAVLTLNTALARARLSDSALTSISDYYAADLKAETIFARLRAGEKPEDVRQEGNLYSYTCPVSEYQTLHVELTEKDGEWTVLRWQTESEDIPSDDYLPVWKKEQMP